MNNAVVILNYNGETHLKNYLENVVENTSENAEIVIIDNASTDNSVDYIKSSFPQLKLIILDKNFGFAGGYNQGLKQLEATNLILLNSDVEVAPLWDIPIWEKLENSEIGAVQPKLVDLKDKSLYEYAGAAGGFVDKYYFPFCRGRIFSHLEQSEKEFDNASNMFWATGAAFGIKKSTFDEVGGFDEDFFAHMEEIDLCYRLQNKGHKIAYENKSVAYHLGGGTLKMMSPFKTYLNYRNGLRLIVKNHYHSPLLKVLIIRMILDGLSGINFLLRGFPKHTIAILKGHFHFYGKLGKTLKKRQELKQVWTGKKPHGIYNKSIVADYFLRKVKSVDQLDKNLFS